MKKYLISLIALSFLTFFSCEKVEVTSPFNIQDIKAKPPKGSFEWDIEFKSAEAGDIGQLDENTAVGTTIGTISATDVNPDDEFEYSISTQEIDGTSVNYFNLNTTTGVLELSNGEINYEAISGSKQVSVKIRITDDSPDQKSSDKEILIDIVDVNETPYFTNINSVPTYADENVDFAFDKIEWEDTDEGQNPSLSSSGPSWLEITSQGQMTGTPSTSDIGNNSFLLTITDGSIDAVAEVNIEVRSNSAPIFTNVNQIPSIIRVGCYDDNQSIVDLNWRDPDNSLSQFQGNDLVSFSHEGTESHEWLNINENGLIFCVTKPENSDAGDVPIRVSVTDNRPNASKTTDFDFTLELMANDPPEFINLGSFPENFAAGDTLEFDLNWEDINDDIINFNLIENINWISWDNSGNILCTPNQNHIGEYELIFEISDGCFSLSATRTLVIE